MLRARPRQRLPRRGTVRRAIAALIVASLATALTLALADIGAPVTANAAVPAVSQAETMLALVNASRAQNGLGPLRFNAAMNQVAANWAAQMAANGAMTHNPAYSSQIPGGWTTAAENVARGYPTPASMHDGWMNSSGHRANILGDFTDVGIAFITVGGSTWGVENFAKYGASVPAPAPKPAPPVTAPTADPAPTVIPDPQPSRTFTPIPSPTPQATHQTTSASPSPSPGTLRSADSASVAATFRWLIAGGAALAAVFVAWLVVLRRRQRAAGSDTSSGR